MKGKPQTHRTQRRESACRCEQVSGACTEASVQPAPIRSNPDFEELLSMVGIMPGLLPTALFGNLR